MGGKMENVTYTQEEKQSNDPKMTQMLKSADNNFKAAYFYTQGQREKYACNE